MLDVIWMDYDTLAQRLGIERASARQRAKRGQWGRRKDNQGRMQVGVPAEVLEEFPERAPEGAHVTPEGAHERAQIADMADMNAFVIRQIERLEDALEEAQEVATDALRERDQMRDERDQARDQMHEAEKLKAAADAQVDALNTALVVERQRVDDMRSDRDRWSAQAAQLGERRGFFGLFRRRRA